jgi:hypothetical protein
MKEGTKPVKDAETTGDQAQKEEPAHTVNWKPGMRRACKTVYFWYDQPSFATWQELYDVVCKKYGPALGCCNRPDRLTVYELIAMNEVVSAMKRSKQECERR